ncbi:hypothetical protein [Sporolactobacillus shoreae]|nr:hypothetical protein [Sporolactobacillus shoreae]
MELRETKGNERLEKDEMSKTEVHLNRKLLLTNCVLAISIVINVKLFFG